MRTAFTNVRVFDGEEVHPPTTVLVDDGLVARVGGPEPAGIDRTVDGTGRTLLPGLVDSHAHTLPEDLATALRFGVTTVLEMGGPSSAEERAAWAARPESADVRSAGQPVTAPHGHPTQLFANLSGPGVPDPAQWPQTSTPAEARTLVDRLVSSGSDYVEFILEDGTVMGEPGLPLLAHDAYAAGVTAAHEHGHLVMTHAQTRATWAQAARAGTDASVAVPTTGGQAHGASVHHEMALLVEAGFSPVRALRAATAVPARRFGLADRGRIAAGLRADLVLVDGDPTTTIGDSLSIVGVWRGGRESADLSVRP